MLTSFYTLKVENFSRGDMMVPNLQSYEKQTGEPQLHSTFDKIASHGCLLGLSKHKSHSHHNRRGTVHHMDKVQHSQPGLHYIELDNSNYSDRTRPNSHFFRHDNLLGMTMLFEFPH